MRALAPLLLPAAYRSGEAKMVAAYEPGLSGTQMASGAVQNGTDAPVRAVVRDGETVREACDGRGRRAVVE